MWKLCVGSETYFEGTSVLKRCLGLKENWKMQGEARICIEISGPEILQSSCRESNCIVSLCNR